jgi:predicted hydrocarbon binding protein
MRVEGLRVMLDAVKSAYADTGEAEIYRMGFSYGRAAWANLMQVYHPKSKEGLAEMLRIYVATGWGRFELLELNPAHLHARIKLEEGFESEGLSTGKPECYFIGGHLAGALSSYFGADLKARETRCVSSGDTHCEFEVSS